MSFNGSGTYNLPTPEYPAVAGTLIEALKFNTIVADIATALSLCITRDGQSPATANLPMGGFRHTGVGKAAARDQYITYEQVQDAEATWLPAAGVGGTANAVTLAPSPGPSALEEGLELEYLVEIENTSEDVTHTVNALAAKNTKKFYGGVKVKIAIGDLQVGMVAKLKYDGTDFVLTNPRGYAQGADVASAGTIDLDAVAGDLVDVTGTTTITAVTLRRGQERTVRFTGILTFTHGASLVLPTGANITTAAGDFAILRGYAAGVVRCVGYFRANGRSLIPTLTRQVTTSGTSIDFTGISPLARRITVSFEGVSTNGTSLPAIRLGTSGGIQATGYNSLAIGLGAAYGNATQDTTGFLAASTDWGAGDELYGSLVLTLSDEANGVWTIFGTAGQPSSHIWLSAGSKSLAGVLDRLRLTTLGGANTFDAGAMSIFVE